MMSDEKIFRMLVEGIDLLTKTEQSCCMGSYSFNFSLMQKKPISVIARSAATRQSHEFKGWD